MPKMNGLELYNDIKKKDKNAKVCFITAYDMNNETLKTNKYVIFQRKRKQIIIKKPIEIDKLIELINKKIDKKVN